MIALDDDTLRKLRLFERLLLKRHEEFIVDLVWRVTFGFVSKEQALAEARARFGEEAEH